ncbi:MAG: polysaccharide deacetylase family protein [Parachlamydiaceae bacterium]|nr:polysaccharide deacetylase family protein [Parachlamydiaceae bacterium]
MIRRFFWICLVLALIAIFCGIFLWLKSHRAPQVIGKCIHCVNTSEKVVAITFDDGPSRHTEEILNILRLHEVPATFFLLGKNAEQFPMLVRQTYQEGHEIGNHSYSHQPLVFKSLAFIRNEIDKTDKIIKESGYQGIIHFRAPYGRKLLGLPWVLYQSNRLHILFDVIPDDWARPGVTTIVNRILAQTKPGSIILCHDGDGDNAGDDRSQTIQALPVIIKELRAAGYQFLTISQLLKYDVSIPPEK